MGINVKDIAFIGGKSHLDRIPLKLFLLQLNIVQHNVFHSNSGNMAFGTYHNFCFKLGHKVLFQVRTGSTKCSTSQQCSYKVQCTSQHNKIRVHFSLFSISSFRALGILANNIVKCAVSP